MALDIVQDTRHIFETPLQSGRVTVCPQPSPDLNGLKQITLSAFQKRDNEDAKRKESEKNGKEGKGKAENNNGVDLFSAFRFKQGHYSS